MIGYDPNWSSYIHAGGEKWSRNGPILGFFQNGHFGVLKKTPYICTSGHFPLMVGQLGSKWLVMTQIGHIISAQSEKSGPKMVQFTSIIHPQNHIFGFFGWHENYTFFGIDHVKLVITNNSKFFRSDHIIFCFWFTYLDNQ